MVTRPDLGLTYEDYVRFPDDGRRWELICGEAYMVPAPSRRHQDIVGSLFQQIKNYVDEHGGGIVMVSPFDVVLAPGDVVQPDVVFIAEGDADVLTDKNVTGTPTWLIEVVSDPVRDKRVKRDRYVQFGVAEYWAVDPELRNVEIYRLREEPVVVQWPARAEARSLPGFSVDVESLLGRPGPRVVEP